METEKSYKIVLPGGSIHSVQGRPTKIKGYSKFQFFAHKTHNWSIRELTTGLRLGSGASEAEAKMRAKLYLRENIGDDQLILTETIRVWDKINEIE